MIRLGKNSKHVLKWQISIEDSSGKMIFIPDSMLLKVVPGCPTPSVTLYTYILSHHCVYDHENNFPCMLARYKALKPYKLAHLSSILVLFAKPVSLRSAKVIPLLDILCLFVVALPASFL